MPSGCVYSQRPILSRVGFGLSRTATVASCAVAQTVLLILIGLTSSPVGAVTSTNTNSALGVNLDGIATYSTEQPFLNIFHNAAAWTTHGSGWDTGEEQYLNLDSDGYPKTLTVVNDPSPQKFTSVGVLLNNSLLTTSNGYYPAGQYVVLYDGQGTLSYGFDASLVSSSAGRDVINVKPSNAGIDLRITSTDPNKTGNYIKNIRVVSATNESALNAGQAFNPQFLGLMSNFRAFRFMDWLGTNTNHLTSWSNRPLVTNAFWGTGNGVPLEIAIQLANTLSADAWLNVPVGADDDYITQMATLVNSQLSPNLKAYVEFSNEVWNSSFSQCAYAIAQGKIVFPNAMNQWYGGNEWTGMRAAQIGDIWYGVYGSAAFNSRVVIVMAGQAANSNVLQLELNTPDWTGTGNGPAANHHIGAAAIAPYFMSLPSASDLSAMLATSDAGVSELLGAAYAQGNYSSVPAGGFIAQAKAWVASNAKIASTYSLPLVAYEGGQGLEGFPTYSNGSPQVNLFLAVNLNTGMIPVYAAYFAAWKAAGGTLFMVYNDISGYGQYGEWGALQSVMQTVSPLSSAPPRWQALQNYMASTSCWWANCTGSVVAVPMAPTNLVVK